MSLWCSKHQKRVGRLAFCWSYEDKDNKDDAYLPWSVCANCVHTGNEGERNEHAGQEYYDGPWATVSASHGNLVDWYFPGPDVSGKIELKDPIRIVPLGEGYLVEYGDDHADQKGFTDRVGVAEWLLGWLGFDEEIVESVRDILAGL